jgi:UDP-GlcNAc3NAcA epimerase
MLFTPTRTGLENLSKEGFNLSVPQTVNADNPVVFHCGDIMYDNTMYFSSVSAEKSTLLKTLKLKPYQFILGTIHRDNNTDIPERLTAIFSALLKVQKESGLDIVLPLHPRTKHKMEANLDKDVAKQVSNNKKIHVIDPAGFLDILALEKQARLIVTDSGGLQKEAFFCECPCVILREQTEWIEIVENGNAILTGSDENKIVEASKALLNKTDFTYPKYYGDGAAAEFICEQIIKYL